MIDTRDSLVIPVDMFKDIVKENGKPYVNAIIIFADILKRAQEEKSSEIQYTYQQMSDRFGISKREANNAIVELEKKGRIKRVFKTLTVNGVRMANVLFIRLNEKEV